MEIIGGSFCQDWFAGSKDDGSQRPGCCSSRRLGVAGCRLPVDNLPVLFSGVM